jgi:hypothetical protein
MLFVIFIGLIVGAVFFIYMLARRTSRGGPIVCLRCQNNNPPQARFCARCGQPLA